MLFLCLLACALTDSDSNHQQQAELIFTHQTSLNSDNILSTLHPLLQQILGFFIIEKHVLRICRDFRTPQEVDALWRELCERVTRIISDGLKECDEPQVFLQVKPILLAFEETLKVGLGELFFRSEHSS